MIASFLICTNICDRFTIDAINSCLFQITKFKYEIVVIVNGENRAFNFQYLKDYYEDKITLIYSNKKGLIENLNLGLKKCRGEYILRFDADDICRPDRLETQVSLMLSDSSIDISYSDAALINADNKVVGQYISASEKTRWFLIYRNYVNHPTVCFKKAIVQKAGGYRHTRACEDYDLWLRLKFVHKAKFQRIDRELIDYRNFSNNGFRRNPIAYWNIAFVKFSLYGSVRDFRLLSGAMFSLFLGLMFSFKLNLVTIGRRRL